MSLPPTLTITRTRTTAIVSIAEAFTKIVTRNTTSTSTIFSTWTEYKPSTLNPTATSTISSSYSNVVDHVSSGKLVNVYISIEVPSTCQNIRDYYDYYSSSWPERYEAHWIWDNANLSYGRPRLDGPNPNPDIAGIGVGIQYCLVVIHCHC
jgi:hypothetical protein